MWNARLDEAQAGIKIAEEISITSDMHITPPLCRKQRGTKEPLDEAERGEWKSWLKTQHSKNKDQGTWSHHFMANRWGNNGNSNTLLFSWAAKSLWMVTAVMKLKDACSLEEKLWQTWESESHSVMSDSLWPHGLYSPWNSPGQNTGVGSLSLLRGIFPTQRSNPGLPNFRQILYQLSHKGSPTAHEKAETLLCWQKSV